MVNVGLLTYKNEDFGTKETFEDFLYANYNGNMRTFLNDRKELS